MSVSYALRRLAEIIDDVEADGVEVRDMSLPPDRTAVADDTVHLTLDVAVSLDDNGSADADISETREPEQNEEPEQPAITGVVDDPDDSDESTAQLAQNQATANGDRPPEESPDEVESSDAESSTGIAVESTEEEEDAEQVVCPEPGCDETFESVPGMKIHRTKIHLRDRSDDDATEATPAYRDPEALEEAYEAHDSFPAMREALDVDVSPQTVRRHMIQHGIHDPSSDADSEPADAESEPEESAPEPPGDVESGNASDDEDDAEAVEDVSAEESEESSTGDQTADTTTTDADETDATPAYRDPEALEEAYEAHDSFPAMREALDVDVSAQTVRRYTIEHGIHDPGGDDEEEESGDGASEPTIPENTALADTLPAEVTTPADVTFAELKEAVRTADTLYHIQQQFDLGREETRDLLEALDLLELVHGRVATKREREELKAEIDSRIRHSIRGNGTSA